MTDPNQVISLVGLVLLGALVLGFGVANAVRDSDWWVIARGIANGKRARFSRFLRGTRRD